MRLLGSKCSHFPSVSWSPHAEQREDSLHVKELPTQVWDRTESSGRHQDRLVIASFALGTKCPFTHGDWKFVFTISRLRWPQAPVQHDMRHVCRGGSETVHKQEVDLLDRNMLETHPHFKKGQLTGPQSS